METKLTLPFVKKGSPFVVKNWTIEKHEKALELLVTECKNLTPKEQDKLFRYYVIYVGLLEIDDSIDFETIQSLHVENIMELFEVIYYAGKVDIFFHRSKGKKAVKK